MLEVVIRNSNENIVGVTEMRVEQLLILQLLEKYKCGDKQMERK